MTDETVLSVRMTPAAATTLKALSLAVGRLEAGLPHDPHDKRDLQTWDAVQWLSWLAARIRLAEQQANENAGGNT